jgi:hypothetical protein
MYDIEEKNVIFSPTGGDSDLSGPCMTGWPARSVSLAAGRGEVQTEKNATVSKVYKRTTRYNILDMPKKDMFCFDDSNAYGEYFSLDLNLWEELNYSIDEHKRINVSRQHAGKEIRIFIQNNEPGEFKTVDNIIMFSRARWSELRRVRGENKGLPLEVNANGTIWIGDRAEGTIKIFIRKD